MDESPRSDSGRPESGSRREELIAAALTGDLGPDEQPEFDALCAGDPTILAELAEMEQITGRLSAAGLDWHDAEPSPDLADRVLAVTDSSATSGTRSVGESPISTGMADETGAIRSADPQWVSTSGSSGRAGMSASSGGSGVSGESGRSEVDELAARRERTSAQRRARAWIAAVAVAAVFVGAVGALGVQSLVNRPPQGPPGTLGAVEAVTFAPSPLAGEVDASLVAHTWGTETVLEVDGFPVGQVFEVVLINTRDEPVGSGAFIGAAGTVDCRMNAGVQRSDVRGVQIQDAQGTVLLSAEVPSV